MSGLPSGSVPDLLWETELSPAPDGLSLPEGWVYAAHVTAVVVFTD